jgi:hypothetical protein
MHEKGSFLVKEDMKIKIPGGLSTLKKDYYPFVMVYDTSEEFSKAHNMSIDLLVYYNFGAMDLCKGSSLMYNMNSPYYSGFYGAYAARYKDLDRQYGLDEKGQIDMKEVMEVTDFDLKELVMKSIGNTKPQVDYQILNEEDPRSLKIDDLDFLVYDAEILMDGMMHEYHSDFLAYIQYGKPPKAKAEIESFQNMKGYGRIYMYFEKESRISFFFYIIASNKSVLEETEQDFILKSTIKGIPQIKEQL